jgi:hypothetical protein
MHSFDNQSSIYVRQKWQHKSLLRNSENYDVNG